MAKRDISVSRLKELLDYDPASGVFTWKRNSGGRLRKGLPAGTLTVAGYIQISVDGVCYFAQRLAWKYVYGCWPTNFVDHIDMNKTNNAIANLRDADKVLNGENRISPENGSNVPIRGVHYCAARRKYVAQIRTHGKHIPLGRYDTAEEASAAYLAAKRKYHSGWAQTHTVEPQVE